MKNLSRIVFAIPIIAWFAVIGCFDADEREQLVQQVQLQADSIILLHRDLRWQADSLRTALVKWSVGSAVLDSQLEAITFTERKLRRASAQLAEAKHEIERLERLQSEIIHERDSTLAALRSYLSDTAQVLGSVRSECSQLIAELAAQTDLILQVRPWYFKWRHDATERSFFEKLFGADKARSPDHPEPDIMVVEAYPDSDPSLPITAKSSGSDGDK